MLEQTLAARTRRLAAPTLGLVIGAALLGVLAFGVLRPPTTSISALIGAPANDFRLTGLDGRTISLADLRGNLVLLNFWASWCIPCREETPLLEATARKYEGRGLRVVGVVYQDSADAARAFEASYGLTYPSALDPDGRTAINYGVLGIPESFLIDAAGVIRDRQFGPYAGPELRERVELYLP
jgi:cytochrome c biogenesis protein CcmG/thiol:disulfide interchange protein DsbE